eukprot:TRINITY_DN19918_c0_g2_i1.p1 TRINITY_DN19918_c0_g2~~TRINITY_DN19918_c0_g2_i1.p1  ORF type:complete len:877 (+),score=209.07 TRINITY_DN19918_c0_g2_i1:44-2674(+)
MDNEDVVLLTLLKEEEKRCVRRKQQAKRGAGLGAPRRVAFGSTKKELNKSGALSGTRSTPPRRKQPEVEVVKEVEAEVTAVPSEEVQTGGTERTFLKRLHQHMDEENRRAYIAAGLLADDQLADITSDEPEETDINPPLTPVARSLHFEAANAAQAASTTPNRSTHDITSEFVNIIEGTTTNTEETISALKQQLETAYSLVEHGDGCTLTKVPSKSPNRILDVPLQSDDPQMEQFSGEATISSIININDGMLQQIHSQNNTVRSQSEAVTLSLTSTTQLLDDLLKGLVYSTHAEVDKSSEESLLSTSSSTINKSNQASIEQVTESLTALINRLPSHSIEVDKLKDQLSNMPPPIGDISDTESHPLDSQNSKKLSHVLSCLSNLLKSSENATAGAWCESSCEDAGESLTNLRNLLKDLHTKERLLKNERKLEASASLRVQGIQEQADWLIKTSTETLPTLTRLHKSQSDTTQFRSHVEKLRDIKKSELTSLKTIDDDLQHKQTCIIAQQELLRKTENRHLDETRSFTEQLDENGHECQQLLDKITELNDKLADKFSQRCTLVKQRVIDIGNNAMEYGREYMTLQTCKKELRQTTDSRQRLTAISKASDSIVDLTEKLHSIHQTWNAKVSSADSAKRNNTVADIERVWHQYQSDHHDWCDIIKKSISAMTERQSSLTQLMRDAEERYDEDDVKSLQSSLQHTKLRIISLKESLSAHSKSLIEAKAIIEEHTGMVLNTTIQQETPSPQVRHHHVDSSNIYHDLDNEVSPEEPSPGSVHMVSISPPMTSWCQSVPQSSIDVMKRVNLSEALASLDRDPSTLRSWNALLHNSDIHTVADLLHIRTEPSVWDAFIPDKPLLKTELSLLLHRHVAAASQATVV